MSQGGKGEVVEEEEKTMITEIPTWRIAFQAFVAGGLFTLLICFLMIRVSRKDVKSMESDNEDLKK